MDNSNRNFVIFIHIQKTGGITIQRIFRRKLGKSFGKRVLELASRKNRSTTLEESFKEKTIKDRYVIGHFCYGVHKHLPKPAGYMTFLRDPTSRIISLYHYSKVNPTAYYHKQAAEKTLEEFALHTPLMELDNGQTRFLAGSENGLFINRTPIGECNEILLETAKRNIDSDFEFIGLTEYFDESVLLLGKIMNWKSCFYLRRNTRSRDISKNEIASDELRKKIAEKNWLDIELYKYAKELLLEKLKANQIDDYKVSEFKDRNSTFNKYFNPPYNLYDQVKAKLRGQVGRPS